MISFYLKWTFTEYKELLSIGLDRIWQIVHNDVSFMVPSLESAGYLREQFLLPSYFLFYFVVFLGQAKYSYFSADFRLKILLYYSLIIASDFAILECVGV